MTGSNPAVLRVGDRVRFDGAVQTIVGLSGTLVRLADEHGQTSVLYLPHLLTDSGFERLGQRDPGPLLPAGLLNDLPEQTIEAAQWWERHIVEAACHPTPLRGLGRGRSSIPRPARAGQAKELAGLGHRGVGARTIKRKRLRYQAQGLAGLVDWRDAPQRPVQGRIDPRALQALGRAIEEATEKSTRTAGYLYWRVQQLLTAEHGPEVVAMPSWATFHRLFDRLSQGRHTTGSARTRRSLANRPDGPFGELAACRPGELVQIDSTELDVLVLLEDGVPGRVELTGTVWTWRPGPGGGAAPDDQGGGRRAAAGPLCDARADASGLGRGAGDGPVGAAVSASAGGGRAAGAGCGPAGDNAGDDRVRPRQGVHLPHLPQRLQPAGHQLPAHPRPSNAPGRAFSPNERYAALVEAAGYVPVALSAEDYIELLPARWQAINAYGVKLNHRTYDSAELNPFRRQRSGVTAKKDRWEVLASQQHPLRTALQAVPRALDTPIRHARLRALHRHRAAWLLGPPRLAPAPR